MIPATVLEVQQPPPVSLFATGDHRPAVRLLNLPQGKSITVDAHIQGSKVTAVIDTAAQVSLVSTRLGERLDLKPTEECVRLHNAQADSWMEGRVLQPVGIQLGGRHYQWQLVEADISDPFILGLDFLEANGGKIDLGLHTLELNGGGKIFAKIVHNGEEGYHVSRVTVRKRVTVPPMSIKFVQTSFQNPAEVDFNIEPNQKLPVTVLPCVVKGSNHPRLCVANFTDDPITLCRHDWLGNGFEVSHIFLDQDDLEPNDTQSPEGTQCQSESEGMDVRTVQVALYSEDGVAGHGPSPESDIHSVEPLSGDGVAGHSPSPDPDMTTTPAVSDDGVAGHSPSPASDGTNTAMEPDDGVAAHSPSPKADRTNTAMEVDDGVAGHSPSPESNRTNTARESDDGVAGHGPSPESDRTNTATEPDDGVAGLTPSPKSDVPIDVGAEADPLPHDIAGWAAAADRLPAHVRKLYLDTLPYLDNGNQARRLRGVLTEYADVFARHELDIGHFNALMHYVKTGQACGRRQNMRRTPLGFEEVELKTLRSMKEAGVIEPSSSDWASPPVLVRKKDNTWRYCIDFRALNAVTVKDAYPLPRIDDCIDGLAGKELFCTLDMNSGYWQIPIAPEDRHKTAFITRYGLYQFLRMPFGTSNAPATFQRCINQVLAGLIWDVVIVYLDDVNVTGTDFDDMLRNLETVLKRFRSYGLKLKPDKCRLFRREIRFLGRVADRNGVRMTNEHIDAVLEWPIPTNRKDLERFLGFINYHRSYLQGLAEKTATLYALLAGPKQRRWPWTQEHSEAFFALRKAMTEAPVLAYPNATDVFILDTDASDVAIGAALSQRQGGEERPIAYGSKVLHPKQRAYCTTRKELLAVVVFTAHFRHYLLGRQFVIRTDHASLVWLMCFRNPVGQVARWLEALSCYDYIIQHRSGGKHVNADGLSRIPVEDTCQCYTAGQELSSLPCRGCAHCSRLQSQWQRFEEDVDDVIPLSVNSLTSLPNHQPLSIRAVAVKGGPNVHGKEDQDIPTTTRGDGRSKTEGLSNYIDQLGPENLRQAQMEDHDIRPILLWLESGLEPSEGELQMQSDSARHYWLHRAQLEVRSGVLYYIWYTGYEKIPLLVVPQTLKPSVLTKVHDSTNAGHLGQTKTYQKAQLRCYWYGLNTDVKLYVATCAACNQNKGAQRKHRAPLTRFQAGLPGERVHLDILGPFLESSKGNRYVLMVIDQFTRWLEMVPLPVQDAESVAKAFFENYVVRFGVPITVHTDQGRNFESDLFKAFCHLLEIAKTRTTPYRPSANGQVERYNQLVLNYLRCYIQKDQRDWDTLIPALGLAIRSTVNRSTGFTPNMLQLGREVIMPVDVWLGAERGERLPPADFIQKLRATLHSIHQEVRSNLGAAQVIMKRDYDVKARVQSFEVGDLVYRRNQACQVGLSRKLCPVFIGPYLVVEVLSPYLYRVEDRKRRMVLHHDKLKRCEDRTIPLWLRRKRHALFQGEVSPLQESAAVEGTPPMDSPVLADELPFPEGLPIEADDINGGLNPDLGVTPPEGTDDQQRKSSADSEEHKNMRASGSGPSHGLVQTSPRTQEHRDGTTRAGQLIEPGRRTRSGRDVVRPGKFRDSLL